MPNGIDIPRIEGDFTYPQPTVTQRLRAFLAAAPVYDEGIDESKYQYSATKRVDHAAALAGGVTFTVIRISNCVTADPYFEPATDDALSSGMPTMLYANVQGYKSGLEQANFAMRTAEPFIKACKHKIVIWGDFEADGLTMTTSARQKLANDFLNGIHAHYETGIYSNVKYWGEMYGNMKPPSWAWLWGAHWTSAVSGTFPSSWDLSRLLIWQYGVWDNYSWAKAVPGNQPDIDKNRWMWAGGSVADFLKVEAPEPPPTAHNHLDLEARITMLEDIVAKHMVDIDGLKASHNDVVDDLTAINGRVTALNDRVSALEATPQPAPVQNTAIFIIGSSTANARYVSGTNKAGRPIMTIKEPRVQFKPGTTTLVYPAVITADGGGQYYELFGYSNPTLYIRAQDGELR